MVSARAQHVPGTLYLTSEFTSVPLPPPSKEVGLVSQAYNALITVL